MIDLKVLKAEVDARNLLNKNLAERASKVRDYFGDLLETKVKFQKQDGSLTKLIKQKVDSFLCCSEPRMLFWVESTHSSISLTSQYHYYVDSKVYYLTASTFIMLSWGEDNWSITKDTWTKFDYSFEEIREKLGELAELKARINEVKSQLSPFSRFM